MRILITGATGFIGCHITRSLRDNHHEFIAAVRDPDLCFGSECRCRIRYCHISPLSHTAYWADSNQPDTRLLHSDKHGAKRVVATPFRTRDQEYPPDGYLELIIGVSSNSGRWTH